MPWGAAIAAAGAIGGALITSDASKSAANTQADASRQASQIEQQQYQQTRADLAPYMQQGTIALGDINKFMADPSMVAKLPGYQFTLNQGIGAIENSAASTGLTGNTLRALSDYGQGTASNYYNQYWQQLMQLANLGQTSAAGVGNLGASAAANIGQNTIGAGNALAAGQIGSAGAVSSGISNGLQNWLLASSLQNKTPSTYDPSVTAGIGQGWGSTDYSLSDIRLKADIQRIGTSPRGYPTYEWTWRHTGARGTGVIAQEVAARDPSAVAVNADGFLMVDYSKV